MPWKKGKNKYIAQVRRNGKRREKVFLTLKEAKTWESEMRKMPDQEWNGTTDTVSLIDWAQAYLDHAKSMYARKTYEEKQRMFRTFFKHIDSTLPVSELTSAMVMQFLLV